MDRRGLVRWQEWLDPEMLRMDQRREKAQVEEVEQLKKALAEKVLEMGFLRGALHKVEARRRQSESAGGAESTTKSREVMRVQGSAMEEGKASGLSVEKMCQVAVVSPVPGFLPVVSAVVLLRVALIVSMLPGALAACVNVMKALRSG